MNYIKYFFIFLFLLYVFCLSNIYIPFLNNYFIKYDNININKYINIKSNEPLIIILDDFNNGYYDLDISHGYIVSNMLKENKFDKFETLNLSIKNMFFEVDIFKNNKFEKITTNLESIIKSIKLNNPNKKIGLNVAIGNVYMINYLEYLINKYDILVVKGYSNDVNLLLDFGIYLFDDKKINYAIVENLAYPTININLFKSNDFLFDVKPTTSSQFTILLLYSLINKGFF